MSNRIDERRLLMNIQDIISLFQNGEIQPDLQNLKKLYSEIKKLTPSPYIKWAAEKELITSCISPLLNIINSSKYAVDVCLLADTCLSTLAFQLLGSQKTVVFFLEILYMAHFFYDESSINSKGNVCDKISHSNVDPSDIFWKYFVEDSDCSSKCSMKAEIFTSLKPQFVHLVIMHGLLSVANEELLLCKIEENDSSSLCLFLTLFVPILELCTTLQKFYFHAFQLLNIWMKKAPSIVEKLHVKECAEKKSYFDPNSDIVQKTISVLEANWENPVKGVPDMIKSIYRCLIDASVKEKNILCSTDDIIAFLYERTMKLSWQTKGKYLVLLCLLKSSKPANFLDLYPDVPENLISNLGLNYVASLIGEIYKEIVVKDQAGDEYYTAKWVKWWLRPIGKALASENSLLRQNLENYVLAWSLQYVPGTFSKLFFSKFRDNEYHEKHFIDVALLKMVKIPGSCPEMVSRSIVLATLHHGLESLRMEAYTFLCGNVYFPTSRKRTDIDARKLTLIASFLEMNLNIDNSAFNQRILAQTKSLLLRIRSTVSYQFFRAKKLKCNCIVTEMLFVDWLYHLALTNIYPGASYQRRRSCLQILKLLSSVFMPPDGDYKDCPTPNEKLFITWYDEYSVWEFSSKDNFLSIYPCLFDFTDDIRMAASDLLLDCSNYAIPFYHFQPKYTISAEEFFKSSFTLCNSCHVKNVDTGSYLCQILFAEFIVDRGLKFNVNEMKGDGYDEESYMPALEFLNGLITILEQQLDKASNDFFQATLSGSIHGIVLMIHRCIFHKDFLEQSYIFIPSELNALVQRLISVCRHIVSSMLAIMSGKAQVDVPSFAEIGEAISDFIPPEKTSEECPMLKSSFEDFEDICIYSLSPEFQLLLSCCWHSIKNSCALLRELVSAVMNFNLDENVKRSLLSDIIETLASTLLKCRHRGVIEACSASLLHVCKSLFTSGKGYDDIISQLLIRSLDSLLHATSVSITRRSAGLPLLIQAIVSSEKIRKQGLLVDAAVTQLLKIIDMPLCDEFDDTKDLPQAHAYHILKVLTADANVSHVIMSWLHEVIPSCILGFSSKSWAIQNGALQLFGILLPRVCGQKKTKSDDSEHNMLLPSELFGRYPNLYKFLLEQLEMNIKQHYDGNRCPGLVPILCLIAKLSPEGSGSVNRQYVEDFEPFLIQLLESPSWHIRNMTSTSLSVMLPTRHSFQQISDMLLQAFEADIIKNNRINGLLMMIQKLCNFKNDSAFVEAISAVITRCLVKMELLCDFNCVLLINIALKVENKDFKANHIIEIVSHSESKMKVRSNLSKTALRLLLEDCNEEQLLHVFEKAPFENQDVVETFLDFLQFRWNRDSSSSFENATVSWFCIMECLLKHLKENTCLSIIQILLKFIMDVCSCAEFRKVIFVNNFAFELEMCLMKIVKSQCSVSAVVTAFKIAAFCLCEILDKPPCSSELNLQFWLMKFYEFCQPRQLETLRFHAANFIAIAGWTIANFLKKAIAQDTHTVSLFLDLCDGTVQLLQDEEEEIRKSAASFPSVVLQFTPLSQRSSRTDPTSRFQCLIPSVSKDPNIQFNVCIQVIHGLMSEVLSCHDLYIQHLWCKLHNFPSATRVIQAACSRKRGLFEQEFVNIFAEPVRLAEYHSKMLESAFTKLHDDAEAWYNKLEMLTKDVKQDLKDLNMVLYLYRQDKSDVEFMNLICEPAVYLAITKIACQTKAIIEQKKFVSQKEFEEDEYTFLREVEIARKCFLDTLPNIWNWKLTTIDQSFPFLTPKVVSLS